MTDTFTYSLSNIFNVACAAQVLHTRVLQAHETKGPRSCSLHQWLVDGAFFGNGSMYNYICIHVATDYGLQGYQCISPYMIDQGGSAFMYFSGSSIDGNQWQYSFPYELANIAANSAF